MPLTAQVESLLAAWGTGTNVTLNIRRERANLSDDRKSKSCLLIPHGQSTDTLGLAEVSSVALCAYISDKGSRVRMWHGPGLVYTAVHSRHGSPLSLV